MVGQTAYEALVDSFYDRLAEEEIELRNCEGTMFTYKGGAWGVISLADQALFEKILYECAVGQNFPIAEKARQAWLNAKMRAPLLSSDILDERVLLALPNGTLDPFEQCMEPHDPEHYTTRRINVEWSPEAECPEWMAMLDRILENKTPKVKEEYIDFLQSFFGLALFGFRPDTPRDLRKGLFLYGPSNTAKTSVAEVLREFFHVGEVAVDNVDQISKDFGLAGVASARALIADDAVKVKSKVDPAVLKKLITGEPMTANVKYKEARNFRFRGPVVITTNVRPKIQDETDAMYNRIALLTFERKFLAKDKAKLHPHRNVVAYLKAHNEFPGILNWAIKGGQRARDLGHLGSLAEATASVQQWRAENDVIFDFITRYGQPDKSTYCSVPLLAQMVSCFAEEEHHAPRGEYAPKKVSNRLVSELASLVDGATTKRFDRTDVSGNTIVGLRISDEGVLWEKRSRERGLVPVGVKWKLNGKVL